MAWVWDSPQQEAFEKIKGILSTSPVLRYYDVNKPIKLSVDASSTALGAVILQDDRPVAYATKALTNAQRNYLQIDNEAFAILHACRKFHPYIYGKDITIETDHKPLEIIFKKPIVNSPLRFIYLFNFF